MKILKTDCLSDGFRMPGEFEKQDGIAFILISYTHKDKYYYLTYRQLKYFWNRAEDGGRKSFRYDELDPDFFLKEVPGVLIPYLDTMQIDLDMRK